MSSFIDDSLLAKLLCWASLAFFTVGIGGSLVAASSFMLPLFSYGRVFSSFKLALPTVPKSWFTAFYLAGLAFSGLFFSLWPAKAATQIGSLMRVLWGLHLTRRLVECLFVHRFSAEARMPLHLWLAGVAHYFFSSFLVAMMDAEQPADLRTILVPLLLFVTGTCIQHWAHRKLAAMRQTKADPAASAASVNVTSPQGSGSVSSPSDSRKLYPVPSGGLFDAVFCPHYLGEIILYMGLITLYHWSNARPTVVPEQDSSPHLYLQRGEAFGALSAAIEQDCLQFSSGLQQLLLGLTGAAAGGGAGAGAVGHGLLSSTVHHAHSAASLFCSTAVAKGVGQLPLLLSVWVFANLGATAFNTRKWYLQTYPEQAAQLRERAAVVPWLL